MIRKISIENFFSIKNELVLDFKLSKRVPDLEAFYKNEMGERYPKILAFFGHNAAGKTNILRALSFLKFFALGAVEMNKGGNAPFEPYLFDEESADQSTKFKLEFSIGEEVFSYILELNQSEVLLEVLKTKRSTYFKREGEKISGRLKMVKKLIGFIAEDVSVLTFCYKNKLQDPELEPVLNFFEDLSTNINPVGNEDLVNKTFRVNAIVKARLELKKRIVDFLKRASLGISDLRFKDKEIMCQGELKKRSCAYVYHRVNGEEKELLMTQESKGVQYLYLMLFEIFRALESGGTVIIDEVNAHLHAHVIKEFLDLFNDSESNPHGAQLILSGHADYIMNYLEKEQIILCEKNEFCVTEAFLLKDLKGLRRQDNIRDLYNAGAYGGIALEL
ncbi:AAA family ATPase [Lentisphaera profundi]|uniref:AAA family ATPase n=1 Tax=Lentisphaera profundi TaxID=1658616 RepID=A0ABY7VY95_9BACT|nr:ATP-binding protein [Lentisphaera profundi]WDE98692.1 AAA family ATPase [Lentisphaera profundi]